MKKIAFLSIVLSFTFIMGSYSARYYVHWMAAGNNDGSGWTDAFTSIKTAIDSASAGDTLFVAAGLYLVSAGDKNDCISLKQGVAIIGSFLGSEDPITQVEIDSRDFAANPSLLIGDLLLNDAAGGNLEDNTHHVVVAKGTQEESIDSTTLLDGFFIYGGNATGQTDSTSVGGGVYLSATGGGKCNPLLRRLIIFGNFAKEGGGMMLYAGTNSECSPNLNSVLFRGNYADGGAGLYCKALGGICSPELNIVDFNYNVLSGVYPGKGAAIFNYAENTTSAAECSPVINISEISHHEGNIDGGAVYNLAGGINEGTCSPSFINMSFYKNGSYGIINRIKNGTCTPRLTNVILWNESINNTGGVVPEIDHCLIEGSNGSGAGWDSDLGNDGGENIDADPLWADPDGRNFGLLAGSPALNAGDMIEGINIGSYQGSAVGEPAKIIIIGSPEAFGNVPLGQTSAEQSYAVKGTNLSGNIDIEAPEGFAITTTSGDYSGDTTSITLTQSGGTVDSTQIYVRFSPSTEKNYFTVLMHTSTGASDKFIILEGNCYDGPELSVTGILEDFDSIFIYENSAEQSFTVEGYSLSSDITVTAPEGFEISLTSGDYSGNTEIINLTPVSNAVPATMVYVRFTPVQAEHYFNNIMVTSTGAEDKPVFVQGTGYGATKPELSEIIDAAGCDGGAIDEITVNISDNDVNSVTLEAISDNTDLIPVAGINITGTGDTRTINLDPNEGQSGVAEITVIATNNQGMKDSSMFLLTVNPNPVIDDISVTDAVFEFDGEITITASSAAGGLQYALDGGDYQSGSTFSGLSSGTYDITVMDANGCVAMDVATVNIVIDNIEDLSNSGLNIYPVPSAGILYINNLDKLGKKYTIGIYSNNGSLVYLTKKVNIKYIDLTGFSKGLYIFKLYFEDKIYIEKFTVE